MLTSDPFALLGLFLRSPFGAGLADLSQEQASAVLGLAFAADHIEMEDCYATALHEMAAELPGVWADTGWVAATVEERKEELEDQIAGRLDLELEEDEDDEEHLALSLVSQVPDEAVVATMQMMAFLGYNVEAQGLDDDYIEEQIAFLAEHRDGPDPQEAIAQGLEARTGGIPGAMSLSELIETVSFTLDESDPTSLCRQVSRALVGVGELSPDAEVTLPAADSPGYALLLRISDSSGALVGWAIPESVIGAQERSALTAVSDKYFGFWFYNDMPPEHWPGALLITALTGGGSTPEQLEQALPQFAATFEAHGLSVDVVETSAKRLNEWAPHVIELGDPQSVAKRFSSVAVFYDVA